MSGKVSVGGIVLCGGQSRRMGASKARLEFGGEPMLVRVCRTVASVASKVVVAARDDQSLPALPPECEVTCDRITGAGPLAGIEAGLWALDRRCRAALVVSCDHPLVTARFLLALTRRLGDHTGVVPVHEGRTYPLVAIYRATVAPTATRLLNAGERRVQAFAAACGAAPIEAQSIADGDDLRSLLNVNDRETLEKLRQREDGAQ